MCALGGPLQVFRLSGARCLRNIGPAAARALTLEGLLRLAHARAWVSEAVGMQISLGQPVGTR
jgi:hypothetical protein